jgi:hypothetical protein
MSERENEPCLSLAKLARETEEWRAGQPGNWTAPGSAR